MSKITWKAGTLLAPVPVVLVSSSQRDQLGLTTVSWTGIVCTHPAKTYISLRPSRYSYSIIRESGVFVINLVNRHLVAAADWCGMKSGRDTDKYADCKLEFTPGSITGCPMLDASPVSIECKTDTVLELGSHHLFLADILSVNVEQTLISKNGKLHLDRADLAAYAHGSYYSLGQYLGNIGYTASKKKTRARHKS